MTGSHERMKLGRVVGLVGTVLGKARERLYTALMLQRNQINKQVAVVVCSVHCDSSIVPRSDLAGKQEGCSAGALMVRKRRARY